jgi:hypothetical protein
VILRISTKPRRMTSEGRHLAASLPSAGESLTKFDNEGQTVGNDAALTVRMKSFNNGRLRQTGHGPWRRLDEAKAGSGRRAQSFPTKRRASSWASRSSERIGRRRDRIFDPPDPPRMKSFNNGRLRQTGHGLGGASTRQRRVPGGARSLSGSCSGQSRREAAGAAQHR